MKSTASDRYTSGAYLDANRSWHVDDSPWKASQIVHMIGRNALRPRTVCEIGCGAGEILVQLHQRLSPETTFTGYEVSPQAYELCSLRSRDRLTFRLGDLVQERNDSVDLILVIDVIEHIEDCFGFLKRIRERATYKIFHIPLDMSLQKIARPAAVMRLRNKVGHIHYFMKETAVAMLEECGYEIVDVFYTAGDIDLPAQSMLARLARLPRRALFAVNQDLAAHVMGGFSLMVLAK